MEGESIKGADAPLINGFIDSLRDSPEKSKLSEKFRRMHTILRAMQCNDLHIENFIIKGIDLKSRTVTKEACLVPIDLESLNRHSTKPQSIHSSYELTEQEQSHIERFKEMANKIPHRVIFISTMSLLGMSSYENITQLTNLIESNIRGSGFQLSLPSDKLKQMIGHDIINGDTPYFTAW